MNRPARRQAARHWLGEFEGENTVKGYARCFGVDPLCSAKELQMLGVHLDPDHLEQLRAALRCRRRGTERPAKADPVEDVLEPDEHFSFVAGYTPGGSPYGVPR